MDDADAKLLAGVIKFNRALTSVNLLQNDIGTEGATAVLRACENNNTLQTVLGLAGQTEADFSSKRWRQPEAILMSAELKVNRALTSLNLVYNQVGAGGAKAIADVLPQS